MLTESLKSRVIQLETRLGWHTVELSAHLSFEPHPEDAMRDLLHCNVYAEVSDLVLSQDQREAIADAVKGHIKEVVQTYNKTDGVRRVKGVWLRVRVFEWGVK